MGERRWGRAPRTTVRVAPRSDARDGTLCPGRAAPARVGRAPGGRRRCSMGEIVAAIGTAHAPQFLTRPDSEDPKQLEAVFEALTGLQARLRALEPDVVIILANDHVENFYLDVVPPFTI